VAPEQLKTPVKEKEAFTIVSDTSLPSETEIPSMD